MRSANRQRSEHICARRTNRQEAVERKFFSRMNIKSHCCGAADASVEIFHLCGRFKASRSEKQKESFPSDFPREILLKFSQLLEVFAFEPQTKHTLALLV